MESLLLTLGHNASCILVRDGDVVCGYEEERLSLVKSDSRFPQLSIRECLKYSMENIEGIYVSHWFPFGELPKNANKYWNPFWIAENVKGNPTVYSVSMDFTHHDCHAQSALAFCRDKMPTEGTGIIVADGFGNFGECLSVYDVTKNHLPKIRHRSFGYADSLGLMYQYATAFLGMKENQDEYKLLGYETRTYSMFPKLVDELIDMGIEDGEQQAERLLGQHKIGNKHDPMYAVDALPAIRLEYGREFEKLLSGLVDTKTIDEYERRVLLSRYVQVRLESALDHIAKSFNFDNLILVGGVFMNVKLNYVLANRVKKISIMPLAGDQGAAIGLFDAMVGFKWPDHLFWGKRNLTNPGVQPEGFFHFTNYTTAKHVISDLLRKDKIVNVVRGAMEFGSRSLCHTSTLANPTNDNVRYINMCNDRDTVMPMAPVLASSELDELFMDHEKVVKSLDYMITALEYKNPSVAYGAANYYPETNMYTGRPQVTRERFMEDILDQTKHKILINTSMNEHGMPICYSVGDVVRCHVSQIQRDINHKIATVVIDDE
jgi:carbamoyltransferase